MSLNLFENFDNSAKNIFVNNETVVGTLTATNLVITGTTIIDGVTGASGAFGPTGATGAIGATGAQGIQGVTGATGAQGQTGNTGVTGIAFNQNYFAGSTGGATGTEITITSGPTGIVASSITIGATGTFFYASSGFITSTNGSHWIYLEKNAAIVQSYFYAGAIAGAGYSINYVLNCNNGDVLELFTQTTSQFTILPTSSNAIRIA